MKKFSKNLILPSIIISTIASASGSDNETTLTKGMTTRFGEASDSITIITNNGEPIILKRELIENQLRPHIGNRPIHSLEIQVHDENNEIIITDRSRLIMRTDIQGLVKCCINVDGLTGRIFQEP